MSHVLWKKIAAGAGMHLTPFQLEQLDAYLDKLIEVNQQINLTRIVDRETAAVKHIADALTLLPHIPRDCKTLADVGTGGGVPGVPLAVCLRQTRVTLIDSTKKKLDAVMSICAHAKIDNVVARHARVESLQQKFDAITVRAVADVTTLLEWCEPMMWPTSVLLMMKGPKAPEELAAVPKRLRNLVTVETYDAPTEELAGHCVLKFGKKM
jgi:16S rRNA (guanine527-N7)-methyltransferase